MDLQKRQIAEGEALIGRFTADIQEIVQHLNNYKKLKKVQFQMILW